MIGVWWTRDFFTSSLIFYMTSSLAIVISSGTFNKFPHGNHHAPISVSASPHTTSRPGIHINVLHSTRQPATTDRYNQGISSVDFLCYNDKTAVVTHDVPCPADSSLVAEVTNHFLNMFLKYHGGDILTPVVTSVQPDDLQGFDLTDIKSAEWMNYNRSDLSYRLENLLQQLQENNTHRLDQLLQYLSSESLRNITTLTHLLLDLLNSTSEFKICLNMTHGDSITYDITCNELQSEIEMLNYLSLQAQRLLAEGRNSSIVLSTNQTDIDGSEDNSNGNNATDVFIDMLIQRLHRMKEDSKVLAEFHRKLLSAINNFKKVVTRLVKTFFSSMLKPDLPDISDQIFDAILNADLDIGKGLSEKIFDPQSEFKQNGEPTSKPYVGGGINYKITDYISQTTDYSTKRSSYVYSTEDSTKAETDHMIGQFNDTVRSETTDSGINMVNTTHDSVRYFEGILEIAVALISSLTKLAKLLNEGKLSESDQDAILNNMTAWHNLQRRTKRDVSGYTIASDICQRQGAVINQTNYISLCTTCLHTTVLDNTYYPRFLTEKICSGGSSSNPSFRNGCLYQPSILGGRPGGLCIQQEIHIIILQKVPGKCMKVVTQGQEIITDQWQSAMHPLRIGCECVVDENSQFAKYTHFP